MLKYKGYLGHVIYDDEAEIFHGEVINIKDIITFQGYSVAELKKAFQESVDDYLNFCTVRGEQPEKPFSGKLNLRLNPELHQKVYSIAKQSGKSLNNWIVTAIEKALMGHGYI